MIFIIILYFLLLFFNIWFFLIRPKKPLIDRATVLLQIIAVYTFAFGLLAQSGILREFDVLAKDLTSSDLFRFLRGNFLAIGLMARAESIGLSPDKVNIPISFPLEYFVMFLLTTLSLLCTIFYLVVVLPLSYIAYVIVSVPVSAIMTSARDFSFNMGNSTISIQEVVTQNTVTTKNMLVAVPSFLISVILKIIQLHGKSFFSGSLTKRMKDWFSAHIRTKNSLLLVSQALLIFVIALHVIGTISSLTILPIQSNQVGEVIGVVLVSFLILLLLILLYLKVRLFRKNIRRTTRERV